MEETISTFFNSEWFENDIIPESTLSNLNEKIKKLEKNYKKLVYYIFKHLEINILWFLSKEANNMFGEITNPTDPTDPNTNFHNLYK